MKNLSPSDTKRVEFQSFLDDTFPDGALCAFWAENASAANAEVVATGRLMCREARRDGSRWRYEVVIDPRKDPQDKVEERAVWVERCDRVGESPDLWESPLGGGGVLRLNSAPPPAWRPTPKMRTAVSKAHPGL